MFAYWKIILNLSKAALDISQLFQVEHVSILTYQVASIPNVMMYSILGNLA